MELFVINGNDYTNHIKVPTYKVNKVDVTDDWEDSNHVTHKERLRKRISGSFTMLFDDATEIDAFSDIIEAMRDLSDDGTITATLYLNNYHTTEETNVFIKYTLKNEKPIYGIEQVEGFEVTVEEP